MAGGLVIVGAGQAGLQLAESARQRRFDGPITLIGDEPIAPYNRPPLSKGLLLGTETEEQIVIRGPEALERKRIDLLTGTRVLSVDRAAKRVALSDGRSLDYGHLAFCTGSRPRPLPVPGADLLGVLTLRSLADARAIAAALETARSLVVIGGGYIGLEVAAAAVKKGVAVTVLEAADRPLARVAPPIISTIYTELHRRHGVDVRCGAQVVGLSGEAGRVTGVELAAELAEGTRLAADLVVVGIGVITNDELARAAGLDCDRGIIVDARSRTSDPAIYAAGDCAVTRRDDGMLVRLESVQNAVEQAKAAAAAMMGLDAPFTASPWFWSDQYDVKLQIAGIIEGGTGSGGHGWDREVIRGRPAEGDGSVCHFREGRIVAVHSFNRPREHMAARRILDGARALTPEQAADEGVDWNVLAAVK